MLFEEAAGYWSTVLGAVTHHIALWRAERLYAVHVPGEPSVIPKCLHGFRLSILAEQQEKDI